MINVFALMDVPSIEFISDRLVNWTEISVNGPSPIKTSLKPSRKPQRISIDVMGVLRIFFGGGQILWKFYDLYGFIFIIQTTILALYEHVLDVDFFFIEKYVKNGCP